MPRDFAAATLVLLIGLVLGRTLVLRRQESAAYENYCRLVRRYL